MSRVYIAYLLCWWTGCAYATVNPGHRGLRFDPHAGGLHARVLQPGIYNLGWCVLRDCGRIDDFDVTYSTHRELVHTVSSEGLAMDVHVAVIYRPVISELYDLANEIGPSYYEEVIGPEFRSSSRGVFARHSYQELMVKNEKIEDEIEAEVRRRTGGKHVEVGSITIEGVDYAPEIANAVRQKLVSEQDALRQKAAIEAEALRKRTQIETDAEASRLRLAADAEAEKQHADLELLKRKNEQAQAEAQVAVEKAEAEARNVRAHAQAQEEQVAAQGTLAKNRAAAAAVTPLTVQRDAYQALGALGSKGTTIYLGDFSHAPALLLPRGLNANIPLSSATTEVPSAPNH